MTWVDLARLAGVPTPVMDSVVDIVSAATGINYRSVGRTLESLGLAHKSLASVLAATR